MDYRTSLIGTESGGNWAARNNEVGAGGKAGHFGRVQFGRARLQEAMDAGAIPQGVTPEQFMASPELQMAAENWHFADLERRLGDLVGREVNGQVMDLGALVAMGHLGGAGGARKYVESGGRYNPSDSFGTSLSDYAKTHGGKASAQSDYARGALGGSYGGKSDEPLPQQGGYTAGGYGGQNALALQQQVQQQNALAQMPRLSMSNLDPRMFQRELNPLALQAIPTGGPYG